MAKRRTTINELVDHQFEECSDLPRELLSSIGIRWRERIHDRGSQRNVVKRRDFLSERHQCSRSRLGKGPIRVRVILNGSHTTEANARNVLKNVMTNAPSIRCQCGRKAVAKKTAS